MKLMYKIMALILMAFLFVSCATTKTGKVTQGLIGTQKTIVAIAVAVDDMCSQAMLSQETCDRVSDIYKKAKVSYKATANTLLVIVEVDSADNSWGKYQAFHRQFMELYNDMYNVAIEFKILRQIEGGID